MRKAVSEIIRGQYLACLPCTASVTDAARLMKERDIGCVLALEGDDLQGILTKRDIINRVIAVGLNPEKTTLKKVMTPNPHTCSPNEFPVEALHRMQMGNFRYLPVVQEDTVIGIVSRRDFIGEEHAKLDDEITLLEHI